jgi:hypothetical protein
MIEKVIQRRKSNESCAGHEILMDLHSARRTNVVFLLFLQSSIHSKDHYVSTRIQSNYTILCAIDTERSSNGSIMRRLENLGMIRIVTLGRRRIGIPRNSNK